MFFLDTSAVIELVHGSEIGKKIRDLIGKSPLAISSLTAYEFFVGLKEKELEAMRSFFKEVQIVDFGFESAFKSAEIEKKLQKKG
ncbi:MAG: type II toxin-antitoxin system VapC family toxin, partial [Candidatus Woesearchaeota archaeon]